MMSDVFQTDDRYAGPILKGQYQVLASAIGSTFYVYDHARGDAVRTEGKDTRRFMSIFDALSYLGFTVPEMLDMKLLPAQDVGNAKEFEMAKAVKVTEAMAKAQASMEKRIAAKKAAAPKAARKVVAKKVVATPADAPEKVTALKATKVDKIPTKKIATTSEVTRRSRGKSNGKTVAARCRELINAGGRPDEEMLAIVRAEFADKKIATNAIKHYRAHM